MATATWTDDHIALARRSSELRDSCVVNDNDRADKIFEELEAELGEKGVDALFDYVDTGKLPTEEIKREAPPRKRKAPSNTTVTEKWFPCSGFPDYEICVGPIVSIRRVKTRRNGQRNRNVAIQLYKKEFWVTLYAFKKARRVRVLDLAVWSSAAAYRRSQREVHSVHCPQKD